MCLVHYWSGRIDKNTIFFFGKIARIGEELLILIGNISPNLSFEQVYTQSDY